MGYEPILYLCHVSSITRQLLIQSTPGDPIKQMQTKRGHNFRELAKMHATTLAATNTYYTTLQYMQQYSNLVHEITYGPTTHLPLTPHPMHPTP